MVNRRVVHLCLMLLLAILAGCSSSGRRSGGYYQNDGPGGDIPANIEAIPDAVPRIEPYAPANFRPYNVFGRQYVPIKGNTPFREEGTASWYGRQFHGNKTANGERYDMYGMSAAHPTLPIPSYAKVTRPATGRTIIVRINDRGPFHPGRVIDLSYVAAAKLGLIGPGSGSVIVEAITHTDIAQGTWRNGTSGTLMARGSVPPTSVSSERPVTQPVPVAQGETVMTPIVPDALAAIGLSSNSDNGKRQGGAGYYLQFGAFGSAENAQALAQRLNSMIAGQESGTVQVAAGTDLFRVQLGPYPDRTQAADAAVRLYDVIGASPTIASR